MKTWLLDFENNWYIDQHLQDHRSEIMQLILIIKKNIVANIEIYMNSFKSYRYYQQKI